MTRPNLLFFFPDQWRWDWMSSNPELPLKTPNLDALVEKGMTFSRCYTSSPLCAPARACLASGYGFERCPAPCNADNYDLSVPTFYQKLRACGYRVAGVGKFDLHKGEPLDWGLDGSRLLEEWGFTDGIDNEGKLDGSRSYRREGAPMGPYLNFLAQQGVADIYEREHLAAGEHRDAYVTALTDEQYCDNWLSENGLGILREMPAGQPWFMQVNFTGPHSPMDVTERMHEAWKDAEFPMPHCNSQERYSAEDHLRNRRYYAAMIENIDRQMGRFIDLLQARGELDNTIIIFCSDHGEMLGDHNRWGKSSWRDASIRVPLVVSGPGIAQGKSSDALIVLHDLTATFADLAGAEALEDADSISLVPLLAGHTSRHREFVYSGLGHWRCVVNRTHKYVATGKEEGDILIDLAKDPWEDHNVIDDNPQVSEVLSGLIASRRA